MTAPQPIDTTRAVVEVKTPRGKFTIGPRGRLDAGFWNVVRRELRTNQQVRQMAGKVTRKTLISWRAKGFPDPVLTVKGSGYNQHTELWSRTQVEEWLATSRPKRGPTVSP